MPVACASRHCIGDGDTVASTVAIPGMSPDHPLEKARRAEATICYWLHRFGYLTAVQVAALAYPKHSQGLVMARRTLRRLAQRGEVLVRKGASVLDEHHYALSLAGARRVWQDWGAEARSGKDVLRAPSLHRDAANWSAIRLLRERYASVWTEREVQTGMAPFKQLGNKVPDVLGVYDGEVTWVEVEASRRGGRDMQSLALWLAGTAFPPSLGYDRVALDPPQDTLYLSEVRFVLVHRQAATLPSRLAQALQQHGGIPDPAGWARDRLKFQWGIRLDAPVTDAFETPRA